MRKIGIFILFLISSNACFARDVQEAVEKDGIFSGRIASMNEKIFGGQ